MNAAATRSVSAAPRIASEEPRIGVVGSGRMAQALGRLLLQRGQPVLYLAGRSPGRSAAAAAFIGPPIEPVVFEVLASRATHILVAVSDSAVREVAERLVAAGTRARAVLHTAGSLGERALDVLSASGVSTGMLHPLQTVPTPEVGVAVLPGSVFAVDASGEALSWARHIAALLDGRLLTIEPGKHARYHAAAVLASNGVTALLDAAIRAATGAGICEADARAAFSSLAMASVGSSAELGPVQALTGPVRRGDAPTVRSHLRALADCPEIAALYRQLAIHLLDVARRAGLEEVFCQEIREALSEEER
ncbi:MAG TPA: DUF2520 domain-containing protein [Gemmatimonadaceae bacterium]|nr:DUF2520 domain-containing protein [Gemmatimonadaceae bacterium]